MWCRSSTGYLVSDDDLKMNLDEFKQKFGDDLSKLSRDKLTILANKRDDPTGTDQIYVFFADEPTLGVKPIRKYDQPTPTHHVLLSTFQSADSPGALV